MLAVCINNRLFVLMNQNLQKQYFTLGRNHKQIIRDGSFATRKQHIQSELFSHHLVENNMRIQGLLRKLHAAYIHEKIPDFYGYFFLGQVAVSSQSRMEDCLNREMQLLKTKQCHYNLIMRSINAREACIKSLGRCLESIFEQVDASLMQKFREEIQHHRQLTALVIEQIKQWKEYLLEINGNVYGDEHITFYYKGNDYVLKILNDIDFIGQSFLTSKVVFSHKQDPFIMRPYTENQSQENQYCQLFRYRAEQQQHYISCLQFLAEERADYLKRKIIVKQEKIKQIERAYQTKQVYNKIILTKPTISLLKKNKEELEQAPLDFVDEQKIISKMKDSKKSRVSVGSEMRQSKFRDFTIKGQKIKKIKQMQLGITPLINPKKFNHFEYNQQNRQRPIIRDMSLGFLKRSPTKIEKMQKQENETDFQTMLRKKQLQVLQGNNLKRRTYSSIRLKDRLSQRKLINDKQGAQELQKILDQLEHSAPQEEEGFINRKSQVFSQKKSLLQHNEEAMLGLRKTILKEIGDQQAKEQHLQEQKQSQRDQLQKMVKQKLEEATLQQIERRKQGWIQGKDVLAHQMDKKALFGIKEAQANKSEKLNELQDELKKQMQLKWLRDVHEELTHREALSKMQKEKKQQQKQRQKQLQIAKRKQMQEQRFMVIEKQERFKVISEQFRQQQRNKQQLQKQMVEIIERQKEKLQIFSVEQKLKLQKQLKQSAKSNILSHLRKSKSQYLQQLSAKKQQQLLEEAHRAEAKKKLQEQFQIEKNLERQRERQQKNKKIKLVAQKMQHIGNQIEQAQLKKQESIKVKQMQQARSSINQIPDFRQSKISHQRVQNKKRLQQQFQMQLFSFKKPLQNAQQSSNLLIKDYKSKIDNQQNLNERVKQLQEELNLQKQQKIEQGKLAQNQVQFPKNNSLLNRKESEVDHSQKFARFSEIGNSGVKQAKEVSVTESDLKKLGINMSPEEYKIYIKKKSKIDTKRITPLNQSQNAKMKKLLNDFQIMDNISFDRNQQSQQLSPMLIKQQRLGNQVNSIQNISNLSQSAHKMEQIVVDSEDLSEVMKLTVHSKMNVVQKKRFVTSDEDSESEIIHKKSKKQKNKKQVKKEQQPKQKSIKLIQQPKKKSKETAQFKIVKDENLEQFLFQHFKNLPKLMRKLNLFKKDELKKMIVDCKSVILIEVTKGQESQALCIAAQNQNKQSIRSLNILHFGVYNVQKTISSLILARDLLFEKDPCSQITFSFYYEKEDQEQLQFIKQFQKQFDPYGAIFQKKINNQQTERKHVLRRMIGQQSASQRQSINTGFFKINQHLLVHQVIHNLGLDLGLKNKEGILSGWTILSLFLSKYGNEETISEYLNAQIKQQNKHLKYLCKSSMKLKSNNIKDIEYSQYDSPFQANLKFIEQGLNILKCDPQIQEQPFPIKSMKLSFSLLANLPFVTTIANFKYKADEYQANYLRLKCGKGSKVLKLKSSLYSSQITVIPCKPSNYKLMVTQSSQFDLIQNGNLDLYLKLFLANVTQHVVSNDEHIWLPQISTNQIKTIDLSRKFGLQTELRSKVDFNFTEYVRNCIDYQPTHKDMFVTPPFIVAVLNSDIQRISQSSPIYIERVDLKQLINHKMMPKPIPESDF